MRRLRKFLDMGWLRKFLALSQRDRTLLLSTFLLLAGIKLGLRLLPFQTLRKLLSSFSQPCKVQTQPNNLDPDRLNRLLAVVHLSSRYMPGGAKCLARALTTQVLASRNGYAPTLRIGIARDPNGQLEAHAWVEIQSQIVIGHISDLGRFTPLPALEGGGA